MGFIEQEQPAPRHECQTPRTQRGIAIWLWPGVPAYPFGTVWQCDECKQHWRMAQNGGRGPAELRQVYWQPISAASVQVARKKQN